MAIYRLVATQGQGKNLAMVGMTAYFVTNFPDIYSYDRVYANFHTLFPGAHYLTNKEMKVFIRKVFASVENGGEMSSGEYDNIIILVDEIDGLYPQWGHGDKECQRDLSGVYQDEKMHIQMFCSTHREENYNKIIRDASLIYTKVKLNKATDTLTVHFIDERFRGKSDINFCPASALYPIYEREEKCV
jgi:hypothetical protein